MQFDIKNLNPGTWFDFDPADPAEGRICLRVCPTRMLTEIARATSKKVIRHDKEGQPFEAAETDEAAGNKLLWDYVIADWENVVDAEGKKIKPSAETKDTLMAGHPQFAAFVTAKLNLLRQLGLKAERRLEKN